MVSIDPATITTARLQGLLLGSVGPRPIALASTLDTEGVPNLAPFSFFNVFSANPPILIFSPARRITDHSTKHTLDNALATEEVVINMVSYAMVQQMSLSSAPYAAKVNEFEKAGFTMVPSVKVAPYRVAASPVQFECTIENILPMGTKGGAGNLIICKVVFMHIQDTVMDASDKIDQHQIDVVARMGGNWYTRASKGMFEVQKPLHIVGMGIDALPEVIKSSKVFTGNDLGKLGAIAEIPSKTEALTFVNNNPDIKHRIATAKEIEIHKFVQQYLNKDDVGTAWNILAAIQ